MNHYAEMLESGEGIAKNLPEAMKYCRMASDRAHPAAMFHLAGLYHQGRHVEKNVRKQSASTKLRLMRVCLKHSTRFVNMATPKFHRIQKWLQGRPKPTQQRAIFLVLSNMLMFWRIQKFHRIPRKPSHYSLRLIQRNFRGISLMTELGS
jgi:TPR repeat protein